MDEIVWLLEQTMRDLQNARRRAGSKKVRASPLRDRAHQPTASHPEHVAVPMRRRSPASHRATTLRLWLRRRERQPDGAADASTTCTSSGRETLVPRGSRDDVLIGWLHRAFGAGARAPLGRLPHAAARSGPINAVTMSMYCGGTRMRPIRSALKIAVATPSVPRAR